MTCGVTCGHTHVARDPHCRSSVGLQWRCMCPLAFPHPICVTISTCLQLHCHNFHMHRRCNNFHMYAMALNLAAKDPVAYVVASMRDKGCIDRAAHLVRRSTQGQSLNLILKTPNPQPQTPNPQPPTPNPQILKIVQGNSAGAQQRVWHQRARPFVRNPAAI